MKACLQLQQLFCSKEDQLATRFIHQNEKSTQKYKKHFFSMELESCVFYNKHVFA